ncbi:MAG: helix-turn-helix domain-containing protein [Chthonomonadales bacterium]
MNRLFTTREAAARLGVSVSWIKLLKKRGALVPANEAERTWVSAPMLFRAEDIYELDEQRAENPEGQAYRMNMNRWGNRTDASRLPLMVQKYHDDIPDRYFGTVEVAEMLGVGIATVSRLAMRGWLPCVQKHPGRRGSRLWFRNWDIQALYMNEEYQKYRRAYDAGRRGERKERGEWEPEWKHVLNPDECNDGRRSVKINHGKYFSVRQAAQVLGINMSNVRRLIYTGRLKASHVPKRRGHEYVWRQQWRILKVDLYALLRNEDYLRRSSFVKGGVGNGRNGEGKVKGALNLPF